MTKGDEVGVLVVDDEAADRSRIASALRAQGHPVLEATSYGDAMGVFDLNRDGIEFLITDLALPDGNGCALAVAIQKQKPDLRVLFISFRVGRNLCKYYGLKLPNLHFLLKPFASANLVKRVRTILKSVTPFPKLEIPKTFTSSGQGK